MDRCRDDFRVAEFFHYVFSLLIIIDQNQVRHVENPDQLRRDHIHTGSSPTEAARPLLQKLQLPFLQNRTEALNNDFSVEAFRERIEARAD